MKWNGNQNIEKYMQPISDALSRHLEDGNAYTDIYNRAYEAIFKAIEDCNKEYYARNVLRSQRTD